MLLFKVQCQVPFKEIGKTLRRIAFPTVQIRSQRKPFHAANESPT